MLPELERRVTALERRIKNGLTLARLTLTGALVIPTGAITSGTYTPTLTSVANVDASTAYQCQYMRVGIVVTVGGRVDIDPTAAASTATRLGVSLPIASNFGAAGDCGGAGYSPAVVSLGFAVEADSTNDRAQITFLSTTTANTGFRFSFTYLVT